MFRWFRRRPGPASRAPARIAQPQPAVPAPGFGDSLALPEVVNEGNSPADWRMWEDSMTAVDSMLQGLSPAPRQT